MRFGGREAALARARGAQILRRERLPAGARAYVALIVVWVTRGGSCRCM